MGSLDTMQVWPVSFKDYVSTVFSWNVNRFKSIHTLKLSSYGKKNEDYVKEQNKEGLDCAHWWIMGSR
jgi:hypothetical protein